MTSGGGFIAGSIIARLLLDKTGWNQAIAGVVGTDAAKLKGTAKEIGQAYKDIGQQMVQAGIGIGLFGGALLGAVTTGVKAFATFDAAMTESLAIMGDVSDALRKDLVEAAREVARETTFTAAEAAKALFYLASAGYSAAESVKTLPIVAKFAQAGMFDLATATSLLADAQSALGMRIRDDAVANMKNMVRIADVLSKANIMANASIEQFSESLTTRAGAALRLVNKDVEEGVAVLAAFADQGVKGAEAGTRLDIVLRDLQTRAIENKAVFEKYRVTVFDASGDLRNMADVIGDLEKALAGKSDEMKRSILMEMEFSDRSVASILNLVGMSDAIRNYEVELRKAAGTTEDIANRQLQTLNAQLKLAQNAVNSMASAFGETLVPALTKVVEKVREAATEVAALAREHPKLAAAVTFAAGGFGVFFSALGGGIIILGTLLRSLGSIISSAGILRAILGKAFTFTFTLVGAAVVITWIAKVREDMKKLTEEGIGFWGKLEAFIKSHNPFKSMGREGLGEFLLGMEAAKKGTEELIETALPAARNLAAAFKPIAAAVFDLSAALKEFGAKTKTQLTLELNNARRALDELEKSAESTPGAVQTLKEKIAELRDQLEGTVTDLRSLKEQFSITFRSETEAQIKRMTDALLTYRGKMTAAEVDRIRAEIDKLASSLKLNLIPAADEVAKHVDQALEKLVEMALKVNAEIEESVEYTTENMESDLDAIVKGWQKTAEEAKNASKSAAGELEAAWAETTDQMAKAFGDAFANILKDGLNFVNVLKNIFQGTINALVTYIGKALSEKIFKPFFDGLLKNLGLAATAAAAGLIAYFGMALIDFFDGISEEEQALFDEIDRRMDDAIKKGETLLDTITTAMLRAGGAVATGETRRIGDQLSEWAKAYKLIADAIAGAAKTSKALEDAWSALLSHAKDLGEESSKWLIDLIRNFREAGKESKALNEYILSWLDTIPAALSVLVDQVKIVTQNLTDLFEGSARDALGYFQELANTSGRNVKDVAARLAELGDIAVLTFSAMIASGKSWIDTVDALRPVLSALREKYKQLGIEAGASLAHLFRIVGVTEKHRELFEAIDATRQILIALGNSVWLTAGAWKTLTGDIVSQFHALRHGGLSVEDSLRAMVPSLQAIVDYAAAYGFELDAQTQSLVNQARVHGWIKDAQKTEANVLVEGFNRVCDILIRIAEVLGADISDLMQDISITAGKFYKTSTDTVTAWKLIGGVLVPFNESLEDAIALAKKLGITVSDISHDMTPYVHTTTGGGGTGVGISSYQEGGIAWTRQLAEVGWPEPEVITPLSKYREPGQAVNVTFNVNAIDRAGVETFLRRDAKPILQRMLDREELTTPLGSVGG